MEVDSTPRYLYHHGTATIYILEFRFLILDFVRDSVGAVCTIVRRGDLKSKFQNLKCFSALRED